MTTSSKTNMNEDLRKEFEKKFGEYLKSYGEYYKDGHVFTEERHNYIDEVWDWIETAITKAREEEKEYWMNQKSNDHDNKIREEERKGLKKELKREFSKAGGWTYGDILDVLQSKK